MDAATVRWLAALMAVTHGVAWMLWARVERPGRTASLHARISPPPLVGRGGDVVQVAPLVYPVVVVVSPGWGYGSWLNWSSGPDLVLQVLGLGTWVVGMSVGVWAVSTLGWYTAVDGLAVGHELVVRGPYRYVRHPVYTAFIAIAVGTALVFRSYLLVAVAIAMAGAASWWATAEESVLGSPEGFGEEYRRYAERTGRFVPRIGSRR